jgi:hypothetical protein
MKKLLIIAVIALTSLFATVPDSKAGVSIGIGFGFPGFYAYPPPYYPYGYPVAYPPVYVGVGFRPYSSYWCHGRRIYYRHHHYWH